MENQSDVLSKLIVDRVDPTSFDVTIGALLISMGAEKYVDIFR